MVKFSIIVPVYNAEKYLNRCLESIQNQTYDNYEVIIVNDGSTDNSKIIIDKYLANNKFKYVYQDNMGISGARNTGIANCTGDYILFVDSDDYISNNMCEVINNNLDENIDLLKFQFDYVYEDSKQSVNDNFEFIGKGSDLLLKLIDNKLLFDTPWLYAYNRKFFIDNKFKYIEGIYHEDFALTPQILCNAKSAKVINETLYYYVQVNNSITRNDNYEKTKKRVYDIYKGFEFNYNNVNRNDSLDDNFKKIFYSYLANSVIIKGRELNKEDQKKYYKMLKNNRVYDLLLTDTLGKKLKKILLKTNVNLYFKLKE